MKQHHQQRQTGVKLEHIIVEAVVEVVVKLLVEVQQVFLVGWFWMGDKIIPNQCICWKSNFKK